MFNFKLIKTDNNSKARTGVIHINNHIINTPVFMPVATLGTIKGVDHNSVFDNHLLKYKILLVNAYHLYLRPGLQVIYKLEGLHNFMNWSNLLLSDSGGFQIFSLSKFSKIYTDGVLVTSYINGSKFFIFPELIMKIQQILGTDIIMPLDVCLPACSSYKDAEKFMHITHVWYNRSLNFIKKNNFINSLYDNKTQFLFPIIQGGMYKSLRLYSARYLLSTNPKGIAIGGFSVGEENSILYDILNVLTDNLPIRKPRYLMGVGTPANILECISMGIDMFDCVIPTRHARNGTIYTWEGIINIKNSKWKFDKSPLINIINKKVVPSKYSKSYIRHLFMSKEMLGQHILTIHNLFFYLELINMAKFHISKGSFVAWKNSIIYNISNKL